MDFLNHIHSVISNFSGSQLAMIAAMVVEGAMRAVPTSKPVSLLQPIGAFLSELGSVFTALSAAYNRVVPPKS